MTVCYGVATFEEDELTARKNTVHSPVCVHSICVCVCVGLVLCNEYKYTHLTLEFKLQDRSTLEGWLVCVCMIICIIY